MAEKFVNDNSITTPKTEAVKRLPCRGCTDECKNYSRCDGLLWRMSTNPVSDK